MTPRWKTFPEHEITTILTCFPNFTLLISFLLATHKKHWVAVISFQVWWFVAGAPIDRIVYVRFMLLLLVSDHLDSVSKYCMVLCGIMSPEDSNKELFYHSTFLNHVWMQHPFRSHFLQVTLISIIKTLILVLLKIFLVIPTQSKIRR